VLALKSVHELLALNTYELSYLKSSPVKNDQNPGVAPPDDALLFSGEKSKQKRLLLAEGMAHSTGR